MKESPQKQEDTGARPQQPERDFRFVLSCPVLLCRLDEYDGYVQCASNGGNIGVHHDQGELVEAVFALSTCGIPGTGEVADLLLSEEHVIMHVEFNTRLEVYLNM